MPQLVDMKLFRFVPQSVGGLCALSRSQVLFVHFKQDARPSLNLSQRLKMCLIVFPDEIVCRVDRMQQVLVKSKQAVKMQRNQPTFMHIIMYFI